MIVTPSSAEDVRALLVAAQSPLVPRLSFVVPATSSRHAASLRVGEFTRSLGFQTFIGGTSDFEIFQFAVGHTVLSVVPDASVAEILNGIQTSSAENVTSVELTDNESDFQRWLEKPDGLKASGLPTQWLARLDAGRCAREQGPWKIAGT